MDDIPVLLEDVLRPKVLLLRKQSYGKEKVCARRMLRHLMDKGHATVEELIDAIYTDRCDDTFPLHARSIIYVNILRLNTKYLRPGFTIIKLPHRRPVIYQLVREVTNAGSGSRVSQYPDTGKAA